MAVHFGPVLPGYKKEISITNATGYSSFSSECYLVSSTPEWDILIFLNCLFLQVENCSSVFWSDLNALPSLSGFFMSLSAWSLLFLCTDSFNRNDPLTFKTSVNHNELLTIMNKEINGTVGLTSQRFSYERKVKVPVLNLKDLKAPEKFKARVTTQNLGNSKLNYGVPLRTKLYR